MGLFKKKNVTVTNTGLGDTQYSNLDTGQAEIMGGVNSNNTGINSLNTAVGGVNTAVGNLATDVGTINTNTAGLGGVLDEGFSNLSGLMGTYNTGMGARFDTINTNQAANAANMATANAGITGLQTGQDAGFAGLGTRFDTVDQANTGMRTAVDEGFQDVDTGQTELSNQMDGGFNTATAARDQASADNRLLNDAGFADIGQQAVDNEAARAAGQTAIQGDISTMSGTADTYAGSIMENQEGLESVQDTFKTSFDNYVDRYEEDDALADQSRADAATAAENYNTGLREDIGLYAQAASEGQNRLGNQIDQSEADVTTTLEGGFRDVNAANFAQSDAISNQVSGVQDKIVSQVDTGFARAEKTTTEVATGISSDQMVQTRDLATLASDIETLDTGLRQDFHQLGNAFDDSGQLITNSIEANGTSLTREIDNTGNLILNRFNSQGQNMGQKMINIDKAILAMKSIPSQGTNTAMGELSPAGSAAEGGFASTNQPYAQTA